MIRVNDESEGDLTGEIKNSGVNEMAKNVVIEKKFILSDHYLQAIIYVVHIFNAYSKSLLWIFLFLKSGGMK